MHADSAALGSVADWALVIIAVLGSTLGPLITVRTSMARLDERSKAAATQQLERHAALLQSIQDNKEAAARAHESAHRAHDRLTLHVEQFHLRKSDYGDAKS